MISKIWLRLLMFFALCIAFVAVTPPSLATVAYGGQCSVSIFDDSQSKQAAYGFGGVKLQTVTENRREFTGLNLILATPSRFLAVDTGASETFYRTMSQEHYGQLLNTGQIPATGETFISPSLEYAQQYNGVTVQFNVQAGTTDTLLGMGVRNAGLSGGAYDSLPLVQSGWGSSSAFFKLEGNVVNVGLGNGSALNTFNNSILNFNLVPKP